MITLKFEGFLDGEVSAGGAGLGIVLTIKVLPRVKVPLPKTSRTKPIAAMAQV